MNFLGLFNLLNSGSEIVLLPVTIFINHSSARSIDPQLSAPIMMEHRPIKSGSPSFDTDSRRSRDKIASCFTFSEDDRSYFFAHRDEDDDLITCSNEIIFIEIVTPALDQMMTSFSVMHRAPEPDPMMIRKHLQHFWPCDPPRDSPNIPPRETAGRCIRMNNRQQGK
jgi:hypothetical protein